MPDKAKSEARIFSANNRFHKMARRPGGISRERALEQAQARIEAIKPGFDVWLDSRLQELAEIVRRAQAGDADPAWIDVAALHSRELRDVGELMGFELLAFIANILCEIFASMNEGVECSIDSIACHVDALFLIRQEPYRNLRPEQLPELSNGLRRIAESVSTVPNDIPE